MYWSKNWVSLLSVFLCSFQDSCSAEDIRLADGHGFKEVKVIWNEISYSVNYGPEDFLSQKQNFTTPWHYKCWHTGPHCSCLCMRPPDGLPVRKRERRKAPWLRLKFSQQWSSGRSLCEKESCCFLIWKLSFPSLSCPGHSVLIVDNSVQKSQLTWCTVEDLSVLAYYLNTNPYLVLAETT